MTLIDEIKINVLIERHEKMILTLSANLQVCFDRIGVLENKVDELRGGSK